MKFDETKTHFQITLESFVNLLLLYVWYTWGVPSTQYVWRLLRSAILIYLACGERGHEGITHRPKDEGEFLAKKKTFEANSFKFFLKGEPISRIWGPVIQNTYHKFV